MIGTKWTNLDGQVDSDEQDILLLQLFYTSSSTIHPDRLNKMDCAQVTLLLLLFLLAPTSSLHLNRVRETHRTAIDRHVASDGKATFLFFFFFLFLNPPSLIHSTKVKETEWATLGRQIYHDAATLLHLRLT